MEPIGKPLEAMGLAAAFRVFGLAFYPTSRHKVLLIANLALAEVATTFPIYCDRQVGGFFQTVLMSPSEMALGPIGGIDTQG